MTIAMSNETWEAHKSELADLRTRLAAAEAALAATKHHWCAYCNFGDETKQNLEDLQAHLKVCEYHPMRKLEATIATANEMAAYIVSLGQGYSPIVARFHEAREKGK